MANVYCPYSPRTPGVTTKVVQSFDASTMSNRTIKTMSNRLRKYGVLRGWGFTNQTIRMCAQQLGIKHSIIIVQPPRYGPEARLYGVGDRWRAEQLPPGFDVSEILKISDMRARMQHGAGKSSVWPDVPNLTWQVDPATGQRAYLPNPNAKLAPFVPSGNDTYHSQVVVLYGWNQDKKDWAELAKLVREQLDAQLPDYMDEMRRLADFIETKPKFTLEG